MFELLKTDETSLSLSPAGAGPGNVNRALAKTLPEAWMRTRSHTSLLELLSGQKLSGLAGPS
jgi:hypothetical protein